MGTQSLLDEITDVGRDSARGGYSRHVFAEAETELREWFAERAEGAGLEVETDRNGNLWAWWGEPDSGDAVVTGSHVDSVPGGGAFDGPLGVASALSAVGTLRERGFRPGKPLGVVVFAEEEGGRFGVPCLGSRLLTGAIDATAALRLSDTDGVTFAEASAKAGLDPGRVGADPARLGRIGRFVELHVEQGRGLVDVAEPVAVGSSVIAHGRWRFSFSGQGNHAGATLLCDRADPMLPAAHAVTAARRIAEKFPMARATVGRLVPTPGGTNVIASTVDLWLDARMPEGDVRALVAEIEAASSAAAAEEGCSLVVSEESLSGEVLFDPVLRDELSRLLGGVPALPTGAGHDAAVLADVLPSAMLYVRNPTGISHAPEEFAEPADVERGSAALADVLEYLCR
ncbi:allantoate amidohydrolase [Prauserella marina]|uniref:N-carbamoyl-L-amino-acid hydrolase n=1 Tax=Prauserella marina TaxID=530584 RepID=A0A222VKH3_9PSEU|nr:allantoate amidohydrolase [Prauserella marina]ASR34436.1 allantoate amidohydrolase [Prauserella marina]PWV70992.1 N-carbamoyl-L-amino-acid hydrolase [Prauserella marina]SDE00029.1 N-carbamoyl-L-amino-acid hydrolase [Prauserella marina]